MAVKKKATKKVVKKATKKVVKKATKKVVKKATKKVAKKATKKVVKKATKKVAKKVKAKTKRKPNAAFMRPLTPSADLAAVVGASALPRTQAIKKMWDYIKKHKLQDAKNRRNINADEPLKKLFGGKKTVSMFELAKIISKHLA